MDRFDYEMRKALVQYKKDLGIKEPKPFSGCIWPIVGILLVIALLKYIF